MPLQVLDICKLEKRTVRAATADEEARRLMAIPGLRPLGATAILAAVPNARMFKTARDFAAWRGLTPRLTGGKQRSGHISKQGDRTLRSLLTRGAALRSRVQRARDVNDPWLRDLPARRPFKVAAVAYAARMARIIWAMLVTGEYDGGDRSVPMLQAV